MPVLRVPVVRVHETEAGMKPPYVVPTMTEVAATPPNGYTAASSFSGCGGSSLGYRMAGFTVRWASEFVPAAVDVYRRNAPDYTHIDTRDIRNVTAADVLTDLGMVPGELDLFDGSPPCSSFSISGKKSAGWGKVSEYSDTAQRTDDLFYEYIRLVDGIQPRVFVAENVAGLVKGAAKGYFRQIMTAMKAAGYRVSARVLDSVWLGVPQVRPRLIFIGVRDDLELDPTHPAPLPYRYHLRDAGVTTAGMIDPETRENISMEPYAVGKEWHRLRPGGESKRYFNLKRGSLTEPSRAITAKGGDVTAASMSHPSECRKLNLVELRSVCGFPPDFTLTGTYRQRYERLGRAVPPPMMARIAATVATQILDRAR